MDIIINVPKKGEEQNQFLTERQIEASKKVTEELMKKNIPFHFEAIKKDSFFAGITIRDIKTGEFLTLKMDPAMQNVSEVSASLLLERILREFLINRGIKNPSQKDIEEHFSRVRQSRGGYR